MKKIIILLASLLLLGCETSPPTSPTGPSVKTGEILLNISFNIDAGLNTSKIVLLEDFANVSCAPCIISNKIIESLFKETYGTEKLIFVKFPTNFPSPVDPFYLAAKNKCDFRMSFYNIFFAPTVIIDGLTRPVPTDSNSIKQAIDGRLNLPATFDLNISKQIQGGALVIDLSVTVKDTVSFNYEDLVLHFVLVESEIEFVTPPGSNGETIFHNVLRLQLPGTQGYDLSELKKSGTAGISENYEETIDELWDITKLHPVVFIQNKQTKEVYQAGSTF